MYHQFYNLAALPFENTPDPRFFFASEQHREALAAIDYTVRMRKGFVMVTGAIGSGKTTVAATMCARCDTSAKIVQVLHGHRSPDALLQQILRALEIPFHRADDHPRMLERLQAYLKRQAQAHASIVLFVDEAQTLSDESLEELRLLSNFDTTTDKPIQVVLVGHPELRKRICGPRLDALRQRIVIAKQLTPLSMADTGAYIAHRLRTASIDPEAPGVQFNDAAVAEVFRYSTGVPRLINFACDNCLLLGFVRETRQIGPAMVRRVVEDMVPNFKETNDAPAPLSFPMETRLSLTGTM